MKYYYLYIPALILFLLPLLNVLIAGAGERAAAREKARERAAAAAAKQAAEQARKQEKPAAPAAPAAPQAPRKRGRPRKNPPAAQRPETISPALAPVVDPAPVIQAPAPALPPMISPETFAAKIS